MSKYLVTVNASKPGLFGMQSITGSGIVEAKDKTEAVEITLKEAKEHGAAAEIVRIELLEPQQ